MRNAEGGLGDYDEISADAAWSWWEAFARACPGQRAVVLANDREWRARPASPDQLRSAPRDNLPKAVNAVVRSRANSADSLFETHLTAERRKREEEVPSLTTCELLFTKLPT